MPITFGSVSDIITLSIVIKNLAKSFDDSCGASAEYQAIIRELSSLEHALLQVEEVFKTFKLSGNLSVLEGTANQCVEQCRESITKYKEKTKKFERGLQAGGTHNKFRDASSKLKWQAFEKDDLPNFRAELQTLQFHQYYSKLGCLLSEADLRSQLEIWDRASAATSTQQTTLLTSMQNCIGQMRITLQTAVSGIQELASRIDMDYLSGLAVHVLSSLQRILLINIRTYNAVLELQARMPTQLDKCWTQDPVILEDALGRVTPFQVEFIDSWEVFDAVLEARLRECPGHREIKRKEYALRSIAHTEEIQWAVDFRRCFYPGQRVEMRTIFESHFIEVNVCRRCSRMSFCQKCLTPAPNPALESQEYHEPDMECNHCGSRYQRTFVPMSTKKPAAILNMDYVFALKWLNTTIEITPRPPWPKLPEKEEKREEEEDELEQFRRSRFPYWHGKIYREYLRSIIWENPQDFLRHMLWICYMVLSYEGYIYTQQLSINLH